jgi:hypothetical protein
MLDYARLHLHFVLLWLRRYIRKDFDYKESNFLNFFCQVICPICNMMLAGSWNLLRLEAKSISTPVLKWSLYYEYKCCHVSWTCWGRP